MMYRQTLAHLKNISIYSPDPKRAELAMHNLMYCTIKMCNRVLTILSLFRFRFCVCIVVQFGFKNYLNNN